MRLAATILLLGTLLSCAAGRRAGAGPASPGAASSGTESSGTESANGATQVRDSARFGYSWTLPPDWEFVPVEGVEQSPELPAIDMHAARKKKAEQPEALLLVTDLLSRRERTKPEDYEELEKYGAELLAHFGAEVTDSIRVTMFGVDAIQVNGIVDDRVVSVRVLISRGRRFELRCSAIPTDSEWPCAPAFASLVLGDMPVRGPLDQEPRVLHLREARFHLEFDAPDDGWLATGPKVALGGAQLVWFYRKANRGIDIQVMDLSALTNVPDRSLFAERYARALRESGATVTIKESQIAGKPCVHLEASDPGSVQKDMFILHWNNTNYSVLIIQVARDKQLIEKVKQGFRITDK